MISMWRRTVVAFQGASDVSNTFREGHSLLVSDCPLTTYVLAPTDAWTVDGQQRARAPRDGQSESETRERHYEHAQKHFRP